MSSKDSFIEVIEADEDQMISGLAHEKRLLAVQLHHQSSSVNTCSSNAFP
jgi:hypothetical protein